MITLALAAAFLNLTVGQTWTATETVKIQDSAEATTAIEEDHYKFSYKVLSATENAYVVEVSRLMTESIANGETISTDAASTPLVYQETWRKDGYLVKSKDADAKELERFQSERFFHVPIGLLRQHDTASAFNETHWVAGKRLVKEASEEWDLDVQGQKKDDVVEGNIVMNVDKVTGMTLTLDATLNKIMPPGGQTQMTMKYHYVKDAATNDFFAVLCGS